MCYREGMERRKYDAMAVRTTRRAVTALLVAGLLLVSAFAVAVVAQSQSGSRVTGDVTWFDHNHGVLRSAKFNAHAQTVMRNGNVREAKGEMLHIAHFAGGAEWFEVDVVCVNISGTVALFAGEIVAASDGYLNRLGWGYFTEAHDGSDLAVGNGNGANLIVNWVVPGKSVDEWCAQVEAGLSPAQPEDLREVLAGNLAIH